MSNSRFVTGLALAVVTLVSSPLLTAAPPVRPASSQPALGLAFGAGGVTVSLANPGGSVFLFGLERQRNRDYTKVVVRERFETAGAATGVATSPLDQPLAPETVWLAVDLASGRTALAAPAGTAVSLLGVKPGQLRSVVSGEWDRFDLKSQEVDVIWSRPGGGLWHAHIGDGGPSDADGEPDGHVAVTPEKMTPLGSSAPPPQRFLPGDTLYVFDDATLKVAVVEVGQ